MERIEWVGVRIRHPVEKKAGLIGCRFAGRTKKGFDNRRSRKEFLAMGTVAVKGVFEFVNGFFAQGRFGRFFKIFADCHGNSCKKNNHGEIKSDEWKEPEHQQGDHAGHEATAPYDGGSLLFQKSAEFPDAVGNVLIDKRDG